MFDQESLPTTMINQPLEIQNVVLGELENRLLGGKKIVDANNVVCFLLEAMSSLTAGAVNAMENSFQALYPKRAQTAQDLYKHMSTWDYLNLFSTPATTDVSLYFDKSYLIRHAKSFNNNYKKIVLPKASRFNISNYGFGLHYPIEIRINKRTDTFLISYDTSEDNPLITLQQNTIKHQISHYGGMDLLTITFPVYQFEKTTHEEDINPGVGFSRVYEHENKFYAARIFHWIDGEWSEMEQTLSDDVYDPRTPTAKLTVASDVNKLIVTIPQVYFTYNDIGSKIKIELYTTLGEMDSDISGMSSENISADFPLTSDPSQDQYSTILNRLPTLGITPASSKIVGGGNGYGFEELSQRVINDTFYGETLITPHSLEKFFEDQNFIAKRYLDGITDRIYHCYKELTDSNQVIVASAELTTLITDELIDACSQSIMRGTGDNSITILPTTLYKFNTATSLTSPVTDAELARINSLIGQNLVDEFNNNIYTVCPFHVRLDLNDRHPYTVSYDLTNPQINGIEFIGENVNVSTQMTVFNAQITHLEQGIGGYDIDLSVNKSDDLEEVDMSNLTVFGKTKSVSGIEIWIPATYVGTGSDGTELFKIHFDSDYTISTEHDLMVVEKVAGDPCFRDISGDTTHRLEMDFDLTLVFLVHDSVFTDPGSSDNTDIGGTIPSEYDDYVPVAEQLLKVNLGRQAIEVSNYTNVLYSALTYETHVCGDFTYYVKDFTSPNITLNRASTMNVESGEFTVYDFSSITHTIIASVTYGDDVLEVEDDGGLTIEEGMSITGPGMPKVTHARHASDQYEKTTTDAYIFSVDDSGPDPVITIADQFGGHIEATETLTGAICQIGSKYGPKTEVTVNTTAASDQITVTDSGGLTMTTVALGGLLISGPGIPCGAYAYSIVGGEVVLNKLAKQNDWIFDSYQDFQAELTSGSNTILVTDAAAATFEAGKGIKGRGIPVDTIVLSVDTATAPYEYELVLSNEVEGSMTCDTTNGSAVLTNVTFVTGDWDNLIEGQTLVGSAGVPAGAVIAVGGINATAGEITMDVNATSDETGITLNIKDVDPNDKVLQIGERLILYTENDPVLDVSGNPIIEKDREIFYHITTMQIDAKLMKSDLPEHQEYITYILDQLRAYFNAVDAAKGQLIEVTKLYFKPLRSLGHAYFKLGNNRAMQHPLELSMGLKFYVDEHVTQNEQLKKEIRENALTIIDEHISTGSVSETAIADEIRTQMAETVQYVDVLGINGEVYTQTLIATDKETRPCLKSELVLEDDGSINVERALDIEFVSV